MHGFKLTWGPGAQEIYNALSREITLRTEPRATGIAQPGARESGADGDRSGGRRSAGMVTAEDMAWGRDLELVSSSMLCEGIEKYMTEQLRHQALCQKIMDKMQAGERGEVGEFSDRGLRRLLHRYIKQPRDYDDAMGWLVNCGQR